MLPIRLADQARKMYPANHPPRVSSSWRVTQKALCRSMRREMITNERKETNITELLEMGSQIVAVYKHECSIQPANTFAEKKQ